MPKKRKTTGQSTSDYNRKYYEENKDAIAARKRKRYQEDPAYREQLKDTAAGAYWFSRRTTTSAETKHLPTVVVADLKPKGTIPVVIRSKADSRYGETIRVPVYTTAAVAEVLGRTSDTIRIWLADGVLPEPHFRARDVEARLAKGKNPRLFTRDELQVIVDARPMLTALPSYGKRHDLFTQAVRDGFSTLWQGVRIHRR